MVEKAGRPKGAGNNPKPSEHHIEELKKQGLTREDVLKHFDDAEGNPPPAQKLEIEPPPAATVPESFTCGACKAVLIGKVDCCPHCQQYLSWG